jgi:hypothetical protein
MNASTIPELAIIAFTRWQRDRNAPVPDGAIKGSPRAAAGVAARAGALLCAVKRGLLICNTLLCGTTSVGLRFLSCEVG